MSILERNYNKLNKLHSLNPEMTKFIAMSLFSSLSRTLLITLNFLSILKWIVNHNDVRR